MSWYFRKLVNLRDKIDKQVVYDAGISGKFRIGKFYNSLISAPQVLYHKDVWHKLKMPKHRFILWQAINGNLQTRDRLAKVIPLNSTSCPRVIVEITSLLSNITSAVVAGVVYHVWCNRNRCVFDEACGSAKAISSLVKLSLKARITICNHAKLSSREKSIELEIIWDTHFAESHYCIIALLFVTKRNFYSLTSVGDNLELDSPRKQTFERETIKDFSHACQLWDKAPSQKPAHIYDQQNNQGTNKRPAKDNNSLDTPKNKRAARI
ncbi:hypothetical protein F8388_011274 [Cannabis sativa]|uniref:Reverse transcriptase zinc-binding domain-containing protein n=1 Tax=Cannabis sativa TaxID=3483 RepID=A0A7J6ESF3_CANSA|nr:hypothetical protein F8388_011274 [Cannabis sativa]